MSRRLPVRLLSSSHLAGISRDDLHYAAEAIVYGGGRLRVGGEMLVKTALILLAAWLLGVLGLYSVGERVHVLLLVGLFRCSSHL